MHINQNERYASAVERWEDSKGWENRLRVLFYTFHASLLRCHCGGWWIMLYWWISPLSFSYSQCTRRRAQHRRDYIRVMCVRVFVYLHIYISLNTHLQNTTKNDLCYCILITKQKGLRCHAWARAHTQKQQEHKKMRTWKWAEHTQHQHHGSRVERHHCLMWPLMPVAQISVIFITSSNLTRFFFIICTQNASLI